MSYKPGDKVRVGDLFSNMTTGHIFTLKELCISIHFGEYWTTEEGGDILEDEIIEIIKE